MRLFNASKNIDLIALANIILELFKAIPLYAIFDTRENDAMNTLSCVQPKNIASLDFPKKTYRRIKLNLTSRQHKIWGWHLLMVLVLCFPLLACGGDDSEKKADKSAQTALMLPDDQKIFLEIMAQYKKDADKAANDLQVSALRKKRRNAISNILGENPCVKNWTGVLGALGELENGDVLMSVHLRGYGRPELEYIVRLVTWTDQYSDKKDKTLVKKGSPLYKKLFNLKSGADVKFSGCFIKGKKDHARVLNDFSAMQRPYILFRFTDISEA